MFHKANPNFASHNIYGRNEWQKSNLARNMGLGYAVKGHHVNKSVHKLPQFCIDMTKEKHGRLFGVHSPKLYTREVFRNASNLIKINFSHITAISKCLFRIIL